MSIKKLVYRPAEVQAVLGIKNTKFWALVKEGKLESRKMGGATVVPAESLSKFIDSLPKVRHPVGKTDEVVKGDKKCAALTPIGVIIEAVRLAEKEARFRALHDAERAAEGAHRGPVGASDGGTYVCGTNLDAACAIQLLIDELDQ